MIIPNDPIRIIDHGLSHYDVLDLRRKEDRVRAVDLSVLACECTLPAPCRLLVAAIANTLAQDEPVTLRDLCRALGRQPRTTVKYLRMLQQACGEDPVDFIDAVISRKCAVADWYRALETHGGRKV